MSVISKCPKCHALVTIPAGLDPEAEVRCPLCVVVYPLREALAEVPPALIPVDTGAITGWRGGSDALAKSDLVAEPYHVAELPSASEGAATATESSPEEASAPDAWQEVNAASEVHTRMTDEVSPAIDTGQTPVDSDALASFSIEESQQYQPLAGGPSMRPRRKKEKGALRFLVEVFLGGVVGLTIGYYVLCWVLGPRHGLPELPLPLLPHTMHWFKAAENPEDAPGQPSAGEPGMPKWQPQTQPPAGQPGPKEDGFARPDVLPVEPRPEQPKPEPQPLPEDYVGPPAPPSFTSDDLGKALKAAHDALNGTGASGELTAEVYAEFCRLGHVLSFVRGDPGDSRLASRKLAVRDLLKKIGGQPGETGQIGRLAGAMLENRPGPLGGILLAGTVGPVGSQGRLHGTVVTLAASGDAVSVLSDRPLPLAEGNEVLVLGSIVDSPAENLVGYHGTKPLVVWVGTAVKLAP